MKIDNASRFPHPVLFAGTDDYKSGLFSVGLTVVEKLEQQQVKLACEVQLTEPTLLAEIEKGSVAVGLFVTCLDTFQSHQIELGLLDPEVVLADGKYVGRVSVRPLIWSKNNVPAYGTSNCHEEFGNEPIFIPAGSIMGYQNEFILTIGREKLAQIETIFKVFEYGSLPAGTMQTHLDSDLISVGVASDIYQKVNRLRDVPTWRPITLNAIFVPAVMEVLNALSSGTSAYESLRWYRIFSAKCDHLGITFNNENLWQTAQKLLDTPFLRIAAVSDLWEV
jgi:hypothetical protein